MTIYDVRLLILLGFLIYATAVIAVYIHFKESLIWVSLVLILNLALLLGGGNYLIRSILFPYSNYFIRQQLDSVINRRFS